MSPETGRGRVPPAAWGYFARSFLPANVVNEKPRYWRMETDISLDDHHLGHCVIPAFVPSKTFSRNKTHHRTHLVPLKTFSWNKMPYEVHLVPLKTFSRNQIAGLGGTCYLHIGLHTISRQKSAAWWAPRGAGCRSGDAPGCPPPGNNNALRFPPR